jgi:rare lipoprotein A
MKRNISTLFIALTALALAWCGTPDRAKARQGVPVGVKEVYQAGVASFYSSRLHGRQTASGEHYNHNDLTAAHRTLPFGTRVKVTNPRNNRSVVVVINDRGPFIKGRIIDLSGEAARRLGILNDGLAHVELVLIEQAENSSPTRAAAPTRVHVPDAEPESPEAPDVSAERFAVQLASYKDESSARRMARSVDGTWVQPIEVDGQSLFRVYFGVFEDQVEAHEEQQILARQGHSGFVKRLDDDSNPPPAALHR